jgi:hypothetical protein
MTTSNVDAPSSLRRTVDRVSKQNKSLKAQNEALIRMVLHQRLRDDDLDWADADVVLSKYRPDYFNPEEYAQAFTADAVGVWLATRRR